MMFHDNDCQLAVNLGYQLVKKKLVLMITKTWFIRCYTIKCDLSFDSVQHNIMHYILTLINNSLSHSNFSEQTIS